MSDRVVSLRHAVEADAPALGALHVRAWQWAYHGLLPDAFLEGLAAQAAAREEMWRGLLREPRPDQPVWVAEQDGVVVGFCNTAPAADDTAELKTLYLEPTVVGRGVGAALVRRALDDLRARGVGAAAAWVLDANVRARRFYENGGWRLDGTEKTEQVWGSPVRQVRYRLELGSRETLR